MIASHDRSGWFGASDVGYIVGNWKTKSWMDWWLVKMGLAENHFENAAMNAGTHWEHRILESLGFPMEFDRQILIPQYSLRVNLDGNTTDTIYECKTHSALKLFRCPKKYFQQVWVQLYAAKETGMDIREGKIIHYGLVPEEYDNYFLKVEPARRGELQVAYNHDFIENEFLPKLSVLSDCLRKGVIPDEGCQ